MQVLGIETHVLGLDSGPWPWALGLGLHSIGRGLDAIMLYTCVLRSRFLKLYARGHDNKAKRTHEGNYEV